MVISLEQMFIYVCVAFGGFFVKFLWDKIVQQGDEAADKIKKYDEQELQENIQNIVQKSCESFKKDMDLSLTTFKVEADKTFEYWKEMYWQAVKHLENVEKDFLLLKEQNLTFYKYQLINTCKKYIGQGWMTQYQFDRLTELHKIYHSLGGNSQGDLYYNKAISLRILQETENHAVNHSDDDLFVTAEDMKGHGDINE